MSSLWAASITVLPPGTWTGLPSTSRLIVVIGASDVVRDEALLMLDVVQELVAKVLDEALHRQRGGVAQGTDGAPGDIVRYRHEHIEILVPALAVLDAVDHPPQPARALAAWRTLAAGLFEVEIREAQQRADHAAAVIHDDHRPGAEHRSRLGDRVVIHVGRHHDLAGQDRHRRAAGDAGLELATDTHPAGHLEQL